MAIGLSGPANIRAVARGSYPSVNVGVTGTGVEIYIFAPGLDKEKVDVSVQRNLLTVSGETPAVQPGNASAYLRERPNGAFRRVLSLPEDTDPDTAAPDYQNGVLHINFKRREEARPRKIEITTGQTGVPRLALAA